MSKNYSMILLFIYIFLHLILVNCQSPLAPALYVFGDSISESGNNNFFPTDAKANYTPYGIDTSSGATGRFTNGKTIIDFIAQSLGLPLVPAYMSLSTSDKINITTGVNYASGASGILPESGTALGKILSLDEQIKNFKDTVLLKTLKSRAELKNLSDSIVWVNIGSNDYINNYLKPANYMSSWIYTPQQFANLLVHRLIRGLRNIYSLGARKFVVFNIGRLGCLPAIVNSINPKPTTPCVEDVNNLVMLYNSMLSSAITELERTLSGSTFVRGDAYGLNKTSAEAGISVAQTPCCAVGGNARSIKAAAPALFVFGDSLLDSGNNNFLVTLARADFPPYGVDFSGGASGRFTNGKTVADFTAQLLGLPFAPSYMSHQILANFTGVNYASGASGILPETGSNLGECISLDQQISLFQSTIEEELQPKFARREDLYQYLSKSIFMVSVGTNDYINNYLHPLFFNTSLTYSSQAFAERLMGRLFQLFKRLYTLGAKKIIMFELGPIGCMPAYTHRLQPRGLCLDGYNQLVSDFNTQLPLTLNRLANILRDSVFIHGQTNTLVKNMIVNPFKYGFVDTKNPCCIAGDATLACTPNLPPCLNDNQYLWWDGYHLTEAAYSIVARDCFSGSLVCSPININQLVQN
ncbi:GDSL esterase/lipase [Thalictrum thalictroides]|uniref:GDSL esterase/lipase n=1 Tax=Thalictrum thalictroides TaxID=46969 RepID=A0A7J6XBS8_THATH|nr:GDSL esterase/lipase [Thalictrum thalictroides]